MGMIYFTIFILCVSEIVSGTVNVTGDGAIKKVLKDYNKYAYPGTTDHPIVKITHALNPVKMDYNPKGMFIQVWSQMNWNDRRLTWAGPPAKIHLPMSLIWTPDLVLYNNAIPKPSYEPNAVISQNGDVIVVPVNQYETDNCTKNDDVIECQFKFGSWTYSGNEIELAVVSPHMMLDNYRENPEYEIVGSSAVRNEQKYSCCPEMYYDILYTIQIKRRQ
ncbi:neuronal acetylcholine receptor subunit alpha-10-like [Mytilus edulis]|uniref:Neurotransmitter-gated ion-channel ligand-binding domain-containing protein n=1 Tax=Mytilus edulis TaxID=6550 RepID=A0A8S3TDT9_MYTED|nr:unnamed protein product [Mytilus edulis]